MIDVIDKERQGLDPNLAKILDNDDQNPERGDYIVCKACSSVLTRGIYAATINGSHQHSCVNPHGFTFHLGCYSQALGCTISGDRTHADSWFAGFQWQYASCADCQQHLGWYFDTAQEFFYGLILDRIQRA